MSSPPPPVMACSFCGRTRQEVRKLIAGPRVFICDECVTLCNDILAEERGSLRVQPIDELAIADRDQLLAEVRRAVEAAFPERAGVMLRDLERLVPPGAALVCGRCTPEAGPRQDAGREPRVACEHFRVATWRAQGFDEVPGVPAVWPWLTVMHRRVPEATDFVLLAPLLLNHPVQWTVRHAPADPR